jgi:phage-related protein
VITIEIFKLFGSIFIDNDEANKSLSDTEKKAEGTGGKFTKLGGMAKVAGGVIAAGVGVAATAMGGLMAKTLETTKEINKFAQVNGMSTDEFQKWDYVAKSVGYSMEQASGDMAMLAERAMDAATGAGENAEMFKKLGVSVKDSSGQLKTQEQLFNETIAGLQGMEDVTERNAIATAMLSTTGEELAPILNMTNEELENMKNNANVISEDDLAKAQEFSDKWNQAKATLGGVFTEIGIRLMPIFQTMLDWVMSNMPQIQSIMDTVFNALSTVVNMAVGVFQEYFLPILSQVWSFIQDNLIPIFTDLFSNVQSNFPVIKQVAETVFNAIWEVAKTVWAFYKDNVMPIFQSLFSWVQGHMPTIRSTVEIVFNKIRDVARMVWAFFKDNILPILGRFLSFIQSRMPQIQSIVEGAFSVIKSVIETVWTVIEDLLLPVLKALWDWISPHIPKVQGIIETAFDAIFWAVDKVVGVFEKVTGAIQTAVDWLSQWNNKEAKKKTVTVEENRVPGGIAGGVQRNATGTNYFRGGATLVGEMGPELVELPKGSKISPANDTRNKLKNGDTYITVNAKTVDMSEKELMRTMKRMEVLYG